MNRYFHILLADEEKIRTYGIGSNLRGPSNTKFFGSMACYTHPSTGVIVHNGYVPATDGLCGTVRFRAAWVDTDPDPAMVPVGVPVATDFDFEWLPMAAKVFRWGRDASSSAPLSVKWLPKEPNPQWLAAAKDRAARLRNARAVGGVDTSVRMFEPRRGFWQPLGLRIGYTHGGAERDPFPGHQGSLELFVQEHDALVERLFCFLVDPSGIATVNPDGTPVVIDYVQAGGPWQKHNALPYWYNEVNPYTQPVRPISFNAGRIPNRDPIRGWFNDGTGEYEGPWEKNDDEHFINNFAPVWGAAELANDPLAQWTMKQLIADLERAYNTRRFAAMMPGGHRGTGTRGRAIGWPAHALSMAGKPVDGLQRAFRRSRTANNFWQMWPSTVYGLSPDPFHTNDPRIQVDPRKQVAQSIEQAILLVAAWSIGDKASFRAGAEAFLWGAFKDRAVTPKFFITGEDGVPVNTITEAVGWDEYGDSYTPWWILGLLLLDCVETAGARGNRKILARMLSMVPPGESKLCRTMAELRDKLATSDQPEHTHVALTALDKAKELRLW